MGDFLLFKEFINMSITAFSIADGDTIKAADANYETYRDRLPVCGTCFGEICLARGEHKISYWRHFPGVGIDCPDRSDIQNVVYQSIKHTSRKQSLALFRQRFLEILDYGIQPNVMMSSCGQTTLREKLRFTLTDVLQTMSFCEPTMLEIAKLIPVRCHDKKADFNTVMFEIYNKHRKRMDVITALIDVAVKNLYNDKFLDFNIDYELKKQIGQITKQHLDIQLSTSQLATQYIFTPGKENILTSLMSYCWLMHKSELLKCNYVDLPASMIATSTSLLGAIPWYRIMTALVNNRQPQNQTVNISCLVSPEGLSILTKLFNSPRPSKPKAQGFGK